MAYPASRRMYVCVRVRAHARAIIHTNAVYVSLSAKGRRRPVCAIAIQVVRKNRRVHHSPETKPKLNMMWDLKRDRLENEKIIEYCQCVVSQLPSQLSHQDLKAPLWSLAAAVQGHRKLRMRSKICITSGLGRTSDAQRKRSEAPHLRHGDVVRSTITRARDHCGCGDVEWTCDRGTRRWRVALTSFFYMRNKDKIV